MWPSQVRDEVLDEAGEKEGVNIEERFTFAEEIRRKIEHGQLLAQVCSDIIRNARIDNVGKYQSCMVLSLSVSLSLIACVWQSVLCVQMMRPSPST